MVRSLRSKDLAVHLPKSYLISLINFISKLQISRLFDFTLPIIKMGKHFGELAKLHGIITFKLSPFEQRAFANAISKGVPNFLTRFMDNALRVLPPFIVGYGTYCLTEILHEQMLRKNPDDYKDDV